MRHLLSYIFHLTRFYCVALCSQALTTSEESAHLCILHTCTKPPGRHSILTQSIDRSPKHTCWPSLHPHTIHQSISQTHLLAVTPSSHNPSINLPNTLAGRHSILTQSIDRSPKHTCWPSLHPHTIHQSISQTHLLAVTPSSHNPSIDLPNTIAGRHSILTQSINRSPKHNCWPSLHPHTIHQSISQTHLLAVTPSSHNPSINIKHTSQPLHPHTIHPSISQSHLLAVTLSSHNPSIDLPKKHLLPSLCPLMHRHPCCC